ncbi:MAG: hypothetical protein R2867_38605 [Caldilineaceae bacterium]
MVTRELLKREIDQLYEKDLDFLHRIIQALLPDKQATPIRDQQEDEPWNEFLQKTYGIFQDEPLERAPQGTLETREELE